MDRLEVVRMRERLERLRWLREVMVRHPGGFVPIATAARVLGVTPTRVHALIREGRVGCIDGMPGGIRKDKFVPIDDLVSAPFRGNRGRPALYGPRKRAKRKKF